jgi:intein-encoded DNA endonuclease-like protein
MIRTRELPIQERIILYDEAMKIRENEGLGAIEIGRKLNIADGTVNHWLCENVNPQNLQKHAHQPNLLPSPELSFVIGAVLSDGCLSLNKWKRRTAKQIILIAKDLDFVEAFNQNICHLLNKKTYYSIQTTKENHFRVATCSSQLYDFLNNDLAQLKPYIEQFPCEFLGALIDGDGSVSMWKPHHCCVRVSSVDRDLLSFCQQLLEDKMGIESKVYSFDRRGTSHGKIGNRTIFTKKIIYDLRIHKREALLKLWSSIKLTIKRKQDRLNKIAQNLRCGEVKEWS